MIVPMQRLWTLTALVCALVLSGCGSVKTKQNAYSYLGRVTAVTDETVTEQVIRPNLISTAGEAGVVVGHKPANDGRGSIVVDRRSSYRRYKVALEQGEQITLRSHVSTISAGNCVRVWILGPGVSPVYWYEPDSSEIEAAQGCRDK